MYYGVVDSWSLKNPTILNDFPQIKVSVQYEPHSDVSKYHYNFLLKSVDDPMIERIQKEMKKGWFSFFWNEEIFCIAFDAKSFKIALPNDWSSQSYKGAQDFARSQGIQNEYVDFKKHYDDIILKLKK